MKRYRYGVLAATVVGAVLRVLSTGNGTLWRDEAMLVFVTRIPTIGGMLDFLHHHEWHTPLFYLLVRGWAAIAGPSDAALAVVPIATAVALIPVVYLVGARAFSPAAGAIAAWIVAIHPVLVFHSPQLRPYSLFALVALASCFFLWRLADGAGRSAWVAYVMLTLAMLYTHNWGWLILGCQGILGLAVTAVRYTRPARRDVLRIVGAWIAIGIGYLPWLPAFLAQLEHAGHSPAQPGLLRGLYQVTDYAIGSPQRRLALLLALGLIGAVLLRPRASRDASGGPSSMRAFALITPVFLLVGVFGAVMASRTDVRVPQAISSLVPFAALLLGHGLVVLARDWHPALAATGAGVALGLLGASATRHATWVKSNAAELAAAVTAQARPDDVVVIAPEWIASSFNYYFTAPNRQIVFPNLRRIEMPEWNSPFGRIADPAALAAVRDTILAIHARGGRIWLIQESRWAERDVPDVELLTDPTYARFGGADLIRAAQVSRHLESVYGPPDTLAVAPDPRRGREILRARLFSGR